MESKRLVYGVEETPPFFTLLLSGAQHVLTLFGSTTLVPFIFGQAMGMDAIQLASLISCVYLSMGIATLLQTNKKLGSGLPIVQGSSFSFIPPVLTIIGIYGTLGPNTVMQYIGGGLIAGGIFQAVIGYSGIIGWIKKFITPVVIAPTIMAIGFSLSGTAVSSASTYWPISIFVVAAIFTLSLVCKDKRINIISVLLSVLLGYVVCLGLSLSGMIEANHPAFVDIKKIVEAPWIRDYSTVLSPWGMPKFDLVVFVILLSGFFAGIIESIGDYHSISYASDLPDPDSETIAKGIGSEGLGMIVSGFAGGVGCTSYTENIGLVNLTKVASRNVVRTGAIILICMSFIGKLSAVVASMPQAVMGGAYLILFALIGSAGISIFFKSDVRSQRNLLIVGFSFLMALGLPGWIDSNKELFINDSYHWIANNVGRIIWSLLKSNMAVAGITAGILDSMIPGTKEERGIGKELKS